MFTQFVRRLIVDRMAMARPLTYGVVYRPSSFCEQFPTDDLEPDSNRLRPRAERRYDRKEHQTKAGYSRLRMTSTEAMSAEEIHGKRLR
jgi:hypothetical protein